ncbi:MAG: amidohydrolase family protein [Faecalicatena sp.]|uniref:amidohydrolase family protein n=1 Tax=Faecalicatena sp. TaxID=2005360 RepID=UPI002582B187|nr:amidohydrolase family protein [Faecalicatena sp.]MCI6464442.1 amidohydrolase family protein [Faecalicatena sp.]MDY5620181.1 amidohydrolase family protein [Lachnospiraceae bacterium]
MIDFHTHIFPDKIAGKTLDFLSARCKTVPFTNGTAEGLRESARNSGVDVSIALPVVTNPGQFESINRFAAQFLEGEILSFGGIHPESGDYKRELKELKNMGFRGIKLHPAYQETFFNDIRYKRIISYASELGFIISVHGGFDPGYPDCIYATPQMSAEVIDEVRPEKLVIAHMGGFYCWDDVERYLVGRDVYLDTAVVFGKIDDAQFVRITRGHGVEKILFATDSPWSGQAESAEHFGRLPFNEDEKRKILDENARKLLTL